MSVARRLPIVALPAWALNTAVFLVLCAAFVVLDTAIAYSTKMSEAGFAQPILVLAWASDMARYGLIVALGLVASLVLPGMRAGWDAVAAPPAMRWALIGVGAVVAWPFLTLAHNDYFNSAYLWDRALLLALLVLSIWRPVALLGVVVLSSLLMWQYAWPALGGPVFAHKQMGLEVLTALGAWLGLRALGLRLRPVDLVLLIAILIAGRYWSAGYAKLMLSWWEYDKVHNALIAAHAHGWLGGWPEARVIALADWIALTEPWVPYGVMAFELAAIALLWSRGYATVVLMLAVGFHLAVVVLYGFVFWTWIAIDLMFLAMLWRWPGDAFGALTRAPRLVVSAALIAIAPLWTDATRLGWFDSSVSYSYRYTVYDADGTAYAVSPRFFAPYDDIMTMSAFSYLSSEHGVLTGSYGIVRDADYAKRLDALADPAAVDALQSEQTPPFNAEAKARFEHFLARVFAHRNAGGPALEPWRFAAPPAQFQSTLHTDAPPPYAGSKRVSRVTVDLVTTWFKDRSIHEVRRQRVVDLIIPDVPPPLKGDGAQ